MFNVTLSKLLSSSIAFTVTCCIVWRSLDKSSLKVLVTIWISNVNLMCNSLSSNYWLYSSTRLSLLSSTLFYKVALEYTYIYNYTLYKYIIYIYVYILPSDLTTTCQSKYILTIKWHLHMSIFWFLPNLSWRYIYIYIYIYVYI